MNSLPIILGLVAAGAVGAFAATVVQPAPEVVSTAPVEDPRVADLVDQVAHLDRLVEDLRSRPPALTASPEPRSVPVSADSAIVAAAADLTEEPLAAVAEEPAIQKFVDKAVAKARKKEMDAMGRMWMARAAKRDQDRLDRFAEEQDLSGFQREEMGRIITTRRDNLSPLYRAMFTPPAEGETRDLTKIQEDMEKVRDESDEALNALLSPEQFEAFRTVEESGRGRWMGGGRSRSSGSNSSR